MRHVFYFLTLLLTLQGFSQDTIYFRNNDIKRAKVSEINSTTVKYRSFDNPDGPQYIADKSSVFKIRYAGGAVDTFKYQSPVIGIPMDASTKPRMFARGENIYMYNSRLSQRALLNAINKVPNKEKIDLMKKKQQSAKSI